MTDPISKTFYSHRIFVIYQPDNYRDYLLNIVTQRNCLPREQFRLKLGLIAWGTILVYQSRMVASDFEQRLKLLVDTEGNFLRQEPWLPLNRPLYRQQLAMQLAIETVTRAPEVKERITEAPIMAQYIYDTLYMPSFYHERGPGITSPDGKTTDIKITRDDLVRHLWLRSSGEQGSKDGKTLTPPATFIPPATVNYLFEGVLHRYFELLAHPADIQGETAKYAKKLSAPLDRIWSELANAVDHRRRLVIYKTDPPGQTLQAANNGNGSPNG